MKKESEYEDGFIFWKTLQKVHFKQIRSPH